MDRHLSGPGPRIRTLLRASARSGQITGYAGPDAAPLVAAVCGLVLLAAALALVAS